MNRSGIRLTADHYYYLVDCNCNRGSVDTAKSAVREMVKSGIKPSVRIYNRIIQVYLEQEMGYPKPNFAKAYKLLEEMVVKSGLWTDYTTHDLFATAFRLVPDTASEESAKWFIHLIKVQIVGAT
jgi:pentatricopeptide repeat protein